MQTLSPCEPFESAADGSGSTEPYHPPPSDYQRTYPSVDQYHLPEREGDVGVTCVDPRICFGDGGDIGYSSEEEDDALQSRVETKETNIKSRGHNGNDPRGRPVCDVRKNHSRMRDNDGIPLPLPRRVAAMTAEWVNHNTPLLQEYAERQISPPLIERVSIELSHPTQFVKGTFQMLSNRNKDSDEAAHPTRLIEPQLLDGFVDILALANEYLRSQFGQELVGDLVPVLLTIITNNFYEAHMRLMDNVVRQAIANMKVRKGPCLEVEDFVFGFDLRMSQDMPFFVDVNHRVRDTLESLRSLKSSESVTRPRDPQTTRYGRTTKPTQPLLESEVKKPKKARATKKNAEKIRVERDTEAATPKTEPASTPARLRKPRARATPKPKNSKQPEASTSSTVDLRPWQSVAGRGKFPWYPVGGHVSSPYVMTSWLPEPTPLVGGPVVEAAATPKYFAPSLAHFQAFTRAPSGVSMMANGTAAPWPSISFAHGVQPQMSAAPTDYQLHPQLQASTRSVARNHVPQLVSQPVPSTSLTDAQLFDFIAWPTETATLTADGPACGEGSPPQSSTLLSKDHRGANPTASELNIQQPQASAPQPPKFEVVEHPLQREKSPLELKPDSSAGDSTSRCRSTSGTSLVNDADLPQPQPIPSLAMLRSEVRISEVAKQVEPSPSPNSFATKSTSEALALIPVPLEEGQTPDQTTLGGYDSDATDGTVSTLVTSHAPTPKIDCQILEPTRRTLRPKTPTPIDDGSSSQRLTIKLPMLSLASDTASTSKSAQSQTLTASTLQPQRGIRPRPLAVRIPANVSSCSRTAESPATTVAESPQLSPLSASGAVTYSPEPATRITKKRKLGKST